MLGEDFDEEFDPNIKDIFKSKTEQKISNNNKNDLLEFSANKSGENKKEKSKKKKKKVVCDNCKALTQKINELEQLNLELLKIKEKLSQENDVLLQKNEELVQNNMNIINNNNELLSINKQLKEEKNNLINKNNELIQENNLIKKQLNSKIKEKEESDKKQKENQDINVNKKNNNIEIKNNNIQNTEPVIKNKEIIYSKKNEQVNSTKFCPIEDFNKLKLVVEELQTKIKNLEQWKNNLQNKSIEKEEDKNIKQEINIKENLIKELEIKQDNNNININNNNIPKYIKKNIKDDKFLKIKNNFNEDNSYSEESGDSKGYSNARTEQNNNNFKKLKQKPKKKVVKKELSLKVKRIPSKTKEIKSIPTPNNNNTINSNSINTKINNINPPININPYLNLTSNNINNNINNINTIISSKKEKPKHKNQKFNSKILTNLEGLDLIARGLVKDDLDSLRNLRVGYKLIYRASEHGGEAEDFHERCDDFEGTLIIIKTKDDNMFGGYTKVTWDDEEGEEKKDENAFVFSINLEKLYFDAGKKYNIICEKNKGPCFVGMFSLQEKILKGKGLVNTKGIQCFEGENEKYEINGGRNEFFVEEMEVFQVIVKTN